MKERRFIHAFRLIGVLLVFSLLINLASCGIGKEKEEKMPTYRDPYASYTDYNALCEALYSDTLGDFYGAYAAAQSEDALSRRYALMALAEAKLLSAAVMLPVTAGGGSYALSRVAPYTSPYSLWGNDAFRHAYSLVTDTLITREDRDAMKAAWVKLRGSGEYASFARSYLLEKGYTLKESYSLAYGSDPETWDILATSRAPDAEMLVNTYDGLYEYDCEGNLQPALALSHTVSEDGLVYTFTIREGVWCDLQGRVVDTISADDFVAGFQHMLDAAGGLEYLVQGVILNAGRYLDGSLRDFDEVGVKAPDARTLVYTLEEPCPYFLTMLGYNVFAPLCRSFFLGRGGGFGKDYDPSSDSYTYGRSPDGIAYCGPYLVSHYTAKNTLVFSQNPHYYGKEQMTVKKLTRLFNDGQDVTKTYRDTRSGLIDQSTLNSTTLRLCKDDALFEDYAFLSETDATTYSLFFNFNRALTHNFNDSGEGVSVHTAKSLANARGAMRNLHFRRAIAFAFDRAAYRAQSVGDELRFVSLRNSFTPGSFVRLDSEVRLMLGDEELLYDKGTAYGKILQDALDREGMPIKVFDEASEEGAGSSDGFDGWYSPENARRELSIAIDELAEVGVEISSDEPIVLELPYLSTAETNINRAKSLALSIEGALGGLVRIELLPFSDAQAWYYAGYYATLGREMNFELYDVSGWGPDYGDPSTYLDTFLPDYGGYLVKLLGIY